jgi:hypothetical protein
MPHMKNGMPAENCRGLERYEDLGHSNLNKVIGTLVQRRLGLFNASETRADDEPSPLYELKQGLTEGGNVIG